jgi:branched-chain amino acid aminotransferase
MAVAPAIIDVDPTGLPWHPVSTMSDAATTTRQTPAFGTVFGETMAVARFADEAWSEPSLEPVAPMELHPAAHVLHYGSACFEGLKAHRGVDDAVRIFRLDRHVARLRASAERLCLPVPSEAMLGRMIIETVRGNLHLVPDSPGSLYIRPTLVGTAPNIGAAGSPTSEATLFILTSPVGDYFAGGMSPLRIAVERDRPRTTPQFGAVKTGANYAMALGTTMEARRRHGVAQVLFAPGGHVQETGASNILLLAADRVVTPALDGSFLEGVTRDSLLRLAADTGMEVEERDLQVEELVGWCRGGEVALTGTAAILAPVGTLVVDGEDVIVGDGEVGPTTRRLRQALVDVQVGRANDTHSWTSPVV